jgi:hypothetical protein
VSASAWLLALTPLAGLAVNVASQVVLCRAVRSLGLLRSLVLGFAVGLLCALGLTLWTGNSLELARTELAAQFLVNGLTTAALGYCYFHFVNLGETARRVRILRELVEAGGSLPRAELLKRYNAQDMVRQRLGRLLRSGQVVVRDGRYVMGKQTVLRMARAVDLVGRLVGLRSG